MSIDVDNAKALVLTVVADHKAIVTEVDFAFPETAQHSRLVWRYRKANWDLLTDSLENHSCDRMSDMEPDDSAQFFTNEWLRLAEQCIPRETKTFTNSTHPWFSEWAISAAQSKHMAQRTPEERVQIEQCSKVLMEKFDDHVKRSKGKLACENRVSKGWWAKVRQFMQLREKTVSIPALIEKWQ